MTGIELLLLFVFSKAPLDIRLKVNKLFGTLDLARYDGWKGDQEVRVPVLVDHIIDSRQCSAQSPITRLGNRCRVREK